MVHNHFTSIFKKGIWCLTLPMLFFSCATIQKSPIEEAPKTYDSEVENEFNEIENSQKQILNFYRELREKNWDAYKTRGKQEGPSYQEIYPNEDRTPPKPRPKAKASPVEVSPQNSLSDSAVKELEIEMGQYMSYFCMSNRKTGRFIDESECEDFTQKALLECRDRYPVIANRGIVNCLQQKLK